MGGAVAVLLLLAFLLWPRGGSDSDVQLVPADERGAPPTTTNPAPMPPAAQAPAPVQPPVATPAQPVAGQPAIAQPGAVPEGVRLTGITATGAIFAFPDGSQRLVARGRELSPGVVLRETRVREVVLSAGTALLRMGFGGTATPMQAAPVATPLPAAATPPPDRNMFR